MYFYKRAENVFTSAKQTGYAVLKCLKFWRADADNSIMAYIR